MRLHIFHLVCVFIILYKNRILGKGLCLMGKVTAVIWGGYNKLMLWASRSNAGRPVTCVLLNEAA